MQNRKKFIIAGALLLITAIIAGISLKTFPPDPDKVKGTIANDYYPAVGDGGIVRAIINPSSQENAGLKVRFDHDPTPDRTFNCVKADDDSPVAVGGRVRCIRTGIPIQVTNE